MLRRPAAAGYKSIHIDGYAHAVPSLIVGSSFEAATGRLSSTRPGSETPQSSRA